MHSTRSRVLNMLLTKVMNSEEKHPPMRPSRPPAIAPTSTTL